MKFLNITALFTIVFRFNQVKCSATYVLKTEIYLGKYLHFIYLDLLNNGRT